jgi:glycosyltransferase involved in cell wall biosynthesis
MAERLPPLPGGKEIHVFELTRRQVGNGHEVELWFREGSRLPEGATFHQVSGAVVGRSVPGLAGSALFAGRAGRSMRRAAAADLVHVHGDFTEAWFVSNALRGQDIPVVMTVHGRLNPRYARISRFAMRRVSHFVALGEGVARDLHRVGIPPDRVNVMSSGLDWDLLGPCRSAPVSARPLLVSVGSLIKLKNHETLIAASRIVRARYPDLEVIIFGEGPERRRLEALIRPGDAVAIAGQVSRPEVYRSVARASVFVLASRRLERLAEGTSTALLEAMALARPCVVSTEATPDAIAGSDSGAYLTADPGSPDEFAEAILRLLDDPGSGAHMGARAAEAVAELGWDNIVERVEAVYETALGKPDRA